MFDSPRCLVFGLLIACGSSTTPSEPAVTTKPPPAEPAKAEPAGSVVVEPTVLSEAQRRRDAELVPLATSIVDAHSNWHGWYSMLVANWSPDGTQVLYGSGRDGSPQIYAVDPTRPAEPPRALTTGPERAIWANYTADGKYVVFTRDNKGDEMQHIWRVGADGSGPVDLTPGDERLIRHEPFSPRDRPDILVYAATRFDREGTPVYVQDVAGGPPREVYFFPKSGVVGAVTPDGKRCLFAEVRSLFDVILFELDLEAGSLRRIYPREGAPAGKTVSMNFIQYSPDGSRIYFDTDEGGEGWVVLAVDTKTGEEVARYTNPSPHGATLTAIVSPTGEHVAVYVDAGNHGEIRVLDARTLALRRSIELPLADVRVGTFRPDGRQFSIMMSLPDQPPDVFAVDPASGEIQPLRAEPRTGLDGLPRVTASIVEVPAHDGLVIPTNVYLPAAAPGEPATRRPVIAIFHGGPMASSAIRWDMFVRFFVALGYAVIEPNVRGSTGFGRAYEAADNREKRLDWLKDLETVNRWTKAQPWCDPARVVVWGASYGGYTTLMALSRQPTLWAAGVDLYGPADLRGFLARHKAEGHIGFIPEWGDPDVDGAWLDELSPMHAVDKITAPLFVYAGEHDPRVPRGESDTIVRALRDRHVPVEYMMAANEGHTVDRRENKIELLTRMARFLAEVLPTK